MKLIGVGCIAEQLAGVDKKPQMSHSLTNYCHHVASTIYSRCVQIYIAKIHEYADTLVVFIHSILVLAPPFVPKQVILAAGNASKNISIRTCVSLV